VFYSRGRPLRDEQIRFVAQMSLKMADLAAWVRGAESCKIAMTIVLFPVGRLFV